MRIRKYISYNPLYFNKHNQLDCDSYSILKNGSILVNKDEEYGVVSSKKEVIIPLEYKNIIYKKEMYFCRKENCQYDIYKDSKIIFNDVLSYILLNDYIVISYSENISEVYDKSFNLVNKFEDSIFNYSKDGLYVYKYQEHFGVKDVLGNIIVPPVYDEIIFEFDLIQAVIKGKSDFFDHSGKKILEKKKTSSIRYLGESLFLLENLTNKKIINTDNEIIRKLKKNTKIGDFENGYAFYANKGIMNYLDTKCNDVFDFSFVKETSFLYHIFNDFWIYKYEKNNDTFYGSVNLFINEIKKQDWQNFSIHGSYLISHDINGNYYLYNKYGEDELERNCDLIEPLNADISLFLIEIDHVKYIYDGIILHRIMKNQDVSKFYANFTSSKYILTKDNETEGLMDVNGKTIIPNCLKHIDYNDEYMILDGYIIPFGFNKNSNLKLSLEDIISYNVDIDLNGKVITRQFKRFETRELFIKEFQKEEEKREEEKREKEKLNRQVSNDFFRYDDYGCTDDSPICCKV